ncbi:MAG: cyclic pyranopterin monophosphate synthase MoaC [Ruminococcaceae bacterium]|nr:cyclic pyranopterin monophosphate synthase MoaC [Oscillospiraceae bacterium]
MEFTHFNDQGLARMVDISEKNVTYRTAVATALVKMNDETLRKVKNGDIRKGNVLAVAQVAGIMAAKNTAFTIPMCHQISLTGADITFDFESNGIRIISTVKCKGETGVEMEALHAVTVSALTIYDMCKAIQKDIEITDIHLVSKTGGKSGDFTYKR